MSLETWLDEHQYFPFKWGEDADYQLPRNWQIPRQYPQSVWDASHATGLVPTHNVCVLDLDNHAACQRAHDIGLLTAGFVVKTPRGYHVYLEIRDGKPPLNGAGAGFDWRGGGCGFVVSAGCSRPDGPKRKGGEYTIARANMPLALDAEVRALFPLRPRKTEVSPSVPQTIGLKVVQTKVRQLERKFNMKLRHHADTEFVGRCPNHRKCGSQDDGFSVQAMPVLAGGQTRITARVFCRKCHSLGLNTAAELERLE